MLTDTMAAYLKQASPWLRFVGVLSFISCGLLAVFGFFMIIASPFMGEIFEFAGDFGALLLGIFYIVLGALFFFPSRYLYNFGARIRNYMLSNAEYELELALKNNRSLWKFFGISSIICLALIPVVTIISVIGAVLSY
jgi:hypothetical protein